MDGNGPATAFATAAGAAVSGTCGLLTRMASALGSLTHPLAAPFAAEFSACPLRSSLTGFATRFCNEMGKERNSVCSPLSCEVVLALTALGCEGASRAELLQTMGLSDDAAIRSSFAFVLKTLKSVKGVTLRLANKVYVTKDGTLRPSIKKDAEKVFDSGLEQLDFRDGAAAADIINKWVAKQTNDKIRDFFTAGSIKETTQLVLVNAIYFQGSWEYPFVKFITAPREFHVNNTSTIQVSMMSMDPDPSQWSTPKFHYKHSPELKAKLLRMYYKGREASMIFILPDEVEGLKDLLQQLASGYDMMREITSMKHRIKVDIRVPKFKIESEIDLTTLLPQLGINTIFDSEKANINMLHSGQPLFVSQAIQKAIIEVDEQGTEAAACTASNDSVRACADTGAPPNPTFIADHPFLYLLETRQLLLFLGAYRGRPVPDASELEVVETEIMKRIREIQNDMSSSRRPSPPN